MAEEAEDEEGEEADIDGFPASSAILGMQLGDHARKNSDGKSSIMGLSALGLESHRTSQDNLPEPVDEQHLEQLLDEVDLPD